MSKLCLFALIGALLLATESRAAEPETCDLSEISGSQELHDALSRLAVEVIERSARSSWLEDARLANLVEPSAEFSLGAGDVGRPLGSGLRGAHALATLANADIFRFEGWDYMNIPADACAVHQVDVEFVDTLANRSARIRFRFRNGRISAASGWQRSIQTGQMTRANAQD